MFGDGDAHALEEFMVEERYVFLVEFVVGEGEGVVVDERRFEGGFGEP